MEKKKSYKKGMSEIIGYVLLITFGIVLSVIVFNYLKTYVPSEVTQCPEGVSIFINNYSCSSNQLNITLKNNGKFNLQGYFIHATNNSTQTLATINLAQSFSPLNTDGLNTSAIYFHTDINKSLAPGESSTQIFDLSSRIYSVEIIPARIVQSGSTKRFISCGGAKVREVLACS